VLSYARRRDAAAYGAASVFSSVTIVQSRRNAVGACTRPCARIIYGGGTKLKTRGIPIIFCCKAARMLFHLLPLI
jgi:hypothetical protein